MGRTERSKEASRNASNEGTAARTRPLSIEEIILRRKNKHTAAARGTTSELRASAEKKDTIGASDYLDSHKDEKKTNILKDTTKERYRKTEEIVSKIERDKSVGKDKDLKGKSKNSKSSRDKESKKQKQTHDRSGVDDRLVADWKNEAEKKYAKVTAERDKHEQRDGKFRGEGKWKQHSHPDDKSRPEADGSILKKHDSAKLRVREYTERYHRKKDYSQTYHEDLRSRRRRSRSHEHDHKRDRRSVSLSPRAHKRPHYGRDYDESSQLHREKPRRKYSDTEKFRSSGNGGYASGHYRKYGSGLGGYSPRKRKTEAAIKTPSPTHRSPERKMATWDQPPAGTSNFGSGSVLTSFQSPTTKVNDLGSSAPLTVGALKPQLTPSLDIALPVMKASIDSVQLTEATRPMRRLYVENLPPTASDKTVIDYLSDFLLSSGINQVQGTKPCISCIMNKDKHQALVEFLTPEDATGALSLDGRSLYGFVLKIRRPKDFVETATGTLEKPVAVVKGIADVVEDSPDKIFVAGISKVLSSDMIMEIVGAFGVLKAFRFEFSEELNGSCAFLEYVDHSVTLKACAGLNGMKLGGCFLTVVRAIPDADGEEEYSKSIPSYVIPMHAKSLLMDPTQVLQLGNLFTREEFLSVSEAELDETLEDIRLECARFGTVKSVNLMRYETVAKAVEQDPTYDPTKIESTETTSECDSDKSNHEVPRDDVKEPQDVREVLEDTDINDRQVTEDLEEKALPVTFQGENAPAHEEPLQLGDLPTDSHKHVEIEEEEGSNMENPLPSEASKLENGEAKLEGDTNLIIPKANACTGDGNKTLTEGSKMIMIVPDKTDGNGDGEHKTIDLDVFEPGCVLVEFLRKEATCMAAHCLHGRLYGERVVTVGYVRHDLYLAQFPR